jgi:hypothetical protein
MTITQKNQEKGYNPIEKHQKLFIENNRGKIFYTQVTNQYFVKLRVLDVLKGVNGNYDNVVCEVLFIHPEIKKIRVYLDSQGKLLGGISVKKDEEIRKKPWGEIKKHDSVLLSINSIMSKDAVKDYVIKSCESHKRNVETQEQFVASIKKLLAYYETFLEKLNANKRTKEKSKERNLQKCSKKIK